MSRFQFVQLSDTHVPVDPIGEVHGVRPGETLRRALARLDLLDPRTDFLVFTGDLAGEDDLRCYHTFRDIVGGFDIPKYYVVGNHDLRGGIRSVLLDESGDGAGAKGDDSPLYYEFEHQSVRFLVLDSQIPGRVEGGLDPEQLQWVHRVIAADARRPTVVFVHHPPVPIDVQWLDEHRIDNGDDLLQILARGNVLRLFFGHVHMPASVSRYGVTCSSVPSTCYQFGDSGTEDRVIDAAPGFQVVTIEGDRLSTRIEYF